MSGFGGFGQQPSQQTTPGFGGGFGTSQTTAPNNNVGFYSTNSSGFGTGFGQAPAAPASTSFGSSGFGITTNVQTDFGASTSNAQFVFGGSAKNNTQAAPFDTSHKSSFTTPVFGAPAPSTGFGFGGAPSSAAEISSAPLTFGSSSTVAFGSSSTTAMSSSGFGSSLNNMTSNQTGFGTFSTNDSSTPSGFGQIHTTKSNQTGFGSSAPSAENKSSAFGFGRTSQNTSNPFGKPAQSQMHHDNAMGDSTSPFGPRIPRKEPKIQDVTGKLSMDAPLTSSRTSEGSDDHLIALRAKIQEKRNRLLQMKQANQNNEEINNITEEKNAVAVGAPTSLSNSELAAKNALRFASSGNNQGQSTSKLLPTDLQDRSEGQSSSNDVYEGGIDAEEDDEDIDDLQIRTLSEAKDLIGVCRSMCPDEELLRREREGDIQLLEITDPGGLHPEGWTLRDTAVKRFRRSAADFKLDIPELVRPPDVLERVCGYLEEWVMERDRQGPDKRFAQQPSIVPPPLDVYQFIWDRTRMIRKDFILQNYIGDGGKCDAQAVRCHERIARWHAMCEHQLSHIQEFVTHQSQQNIAELGQTMKTLNLFYDDSLGRALNEEARSSAQEYFQGCASDIVLGKSPVDFDGSNLSNTSSSEDISKRIIGANGMKSPTRGTAEPEMRGLYILLTMNNEGGMEVIKYSGRLCTQRPEIFYSKPVQLALSIFQASLTYQIAKKDHNYAKFFHLLKSPSTPYLFACIMFKYVEQMRKTALTIMSRTYGAKHKTTGESFYDEYPLENLVNLLCFEDEDEARATCTHYGIALEGNVIRWRNSKFVEPRDPVKGILLTLKPRKMIRSIECKLNGATRLSVCRGGVSGDGATLSAINGMQSHRNDESVFQESKLAASLLAAERAKKEAMEEKARQRKILEQIEQQKRELAAKKEAERKHLEAIAEEKRKADQLKMERRQKELDEQKRLEQIRQEELRVKTERENVLKREAEERKAAAKRVEEEKQELARRQLLEKQRKEEETKRRLAEEAERKRKIEEETRRQAKLEEQRRIAYELEQERLAKEERERKEREEKERKWLLKIESAKKILIWSLWWNEVQKRRRVTPSTISLEHLDPTRTCCSWLTSLSIPSVVYNRLDFETNNRAQVFDTKLYQLATSLRDICDLSQIMAKSFWKSSLLTTITCSQIPWVQPTLLFKLSVVLPHKTPETESIISSLTSWADSHLQFHRISTSTSIDRSKSRSVKVHATATIGNEDPNLCGDCDAALFLLPSNESMTDVFFSNDLLDSLPDHVPRMVLLIGDTSNKINYPKDLIDDVMGPESPQSHKSQTRKGVVISETSELDSVFHTCCTSLITSCLEVTFVQPIIRVSLSKLSFVCLQRLLQNLSVNGSLLQYQSPDDTFHTLYNHSLSALTTMVNELSNLFIEIKNSTQIWPAKNFVCDRSKAVENYFEKQEDLSCDWYLSFQDTTMIKEKVFDAYQYLFTSNSFISLLAGTANKVRDSNRQQYIFRMLDQNNLAACFAEVVSMVVDGDINADYEEMPTIYLPAKKMLEIIETSGHCERPSRRTPELADIPNFLHSSLPFHFDEDISKTNNSSHQVEKYIQKELSNESSTPPVMHKRKLWNDSFISPLEKTGKKRFRTTVPNRIDSEEVQNSKDFTSNLEALLG